MKTLVASFILLSAVAIYFTIGNSRQERDDRAAIHQLVDRYYDALRNGRYEEAATYYESTTFVGTGITNPPLALKQATALSGGIPPVVKVEALRIQGDEATCELLIDRKGIGGTYYVMKDENGKVLGTWARTLHFVRENGTWKISKRSDNSAGVDTQKALDMLNKIREQQQKRK